MALTFPTTHQKKPSGLTMLPSGMKRPNLGALYGFDAQGGGVVLGPEGVADGRGSSIVVDGSGPKFLSVAGNHEAPATGTASTLGYPDQDLTITAWFKLDGLTTGFPTSGSTGTNGAGHIISWGKDAGGELRSLMVFDKRLTFEGWSTDDPNFSNRDARAVGDLSDGTWYFGAVTIADGGDTRPVKMYYSTVDSGQAGSEAALTKVTEKWVAGSSSWVTITAIPSALVARDTDWRGPVIGRLPTESNGSYRSGFKGSIHSVAVWNSALDGDEIFALFNGGDPDVNLTDRAGDYNSQDNLVSWWRMGAGSSGGGSDILGNTRGIIYDMSEAAGDRTMLGKGTGAGYLDTYSFVGDAFVGDDGSSLEGNIQNAPYTLTAPYSDKCMRFDGVDECVRLEVGETTLDSVLATNTNWTIAVWIRPISGGALYYAILNSNGFQWYVQPGGGFALWISDSSTSDGNYHITGDGGGVNGGTKSSGATVDGRWMHAVLRRGTSGTSGTTGNDSMKIFVDGAGGSSWDCTTATIQSVAAQGNVYGIGTKADSALWSFKGDMDDMAVWNSALSDADIMTLASPRPGDLDNTSGVPVPQHWWKFGEGGDAFVGSEWVLEDYGDATDYDADSVNMEEADVIDTNASGGDGP